MGKAKRLHVHGSDNRPLRSFNAETPAFPHVRDDSSLLSRVDDDPYFTGHRFKTEVV